MNYSDTDRVKLMHRTPKTMKQRSEDPEDTGLRQRHLTSGNWNRFLLPLPTGSVNLAMIFSISYVGISLQGGCKVRMSCVSIVKGYVCG
jgi:hypothetical protein